MICSADYLLIRHLKPQAESGICYGRLDLPAAEVPDSACAVLAADFFATNPQALLFSSPLQRAAQLAQVMAGAVLTDPTFDAAWQEIDFGRWEGLKWSSIPKTDIDAWQQNLSGFDAHGGESALQLQQRVLKAWQAWLQQRQGGILISHLGVIRMLMGQVLEMPLSSQLRLQLDYQHLIWLRRTWQCQCDKGGCSSHCKPLPQSEVWQVKGLNWPIEMAIPFFK
ncbi:histidine phosphatase family protein [Oceanospirillum beijerinckii]|uniref:histidine phosphatase family protein n=1 Tax=Oceanospirillum beijerinckii TaxID=64976 RepID=UPI0003FAA035|nr:histidine phosphatase family protein [Oceanospirillum beijerinckii]MAC48283.1 hypothetical protein [Oceanospirillum sp.]